MAASEMEILQRSEATVAVADSLQATWVWDEMNVADYEARLAAARLAGTVEADKKAAYDEQRGVVDVRFEDLDRRKVQGLGMARNRFRHDSEQIVMIEGVGEYGESREATLKEADEWVATWKRVDPAWNPTATNTLAAFETLLADCKAQLPLLIGAKADYRKAGVGYNQKLAELEDLCIAWYAAATRVFAEDTPEGKLIRGQVPTFGGSTEAAPPVVPPTP